MKKVILIMLIALAITACKKDTEESGTLTVYNSSSNRYTFELETTNGSQIQNTALNGKSEKVFTLDADFYDYFAEQTEGYLITPTTKGGRIQIKPGENTNLTIP